MIKGNRQRALAYPCNNALKRMNGYAVPEELE